MGGERLIVLSHPVPRPETPALTEAEQDVRRFLLQGATYAEIAEARGTSRLTVRKQVHALYVKLGVSGRRELAAASRSTG